MPWWISTRCLEIRCEQWGKNFTLTSNVVPVSDQCVRLGLGNLGEVWKYGGPRGGPHTSIPPGALVWENINFAALGGPRCLVHLLRPLESYSRIVVPRGAF